MVDRAVPDGFSSDDAGEEVGPSMSAAMAEVVEEREKKGPVNPRNIELMKTLTSVGRGLDGKLHGVVGGARWVTLEHEGNPGREFWGDSGPVGDFADKAATSPMVSGFATAESAAMSKTMDSITFQDGAYYGTRLRDGLWSQTFILLNACSEDERWQLISEEAIPSLPLHVEEVETITATMTATLPSSGTTMTVTPWPPTPSAYPPSKAVPDGTTSDKRPQINFRSSEDFKYRLRVAAAKANMGIGEYVERLLSVALEEIEGTEAILAGAQVLTFEFEVTATPAAENPTATIDLIRNILKGKGYMVAAVDTAGFGYCTDHGIWRRQYEPCRRLTPAELNRLACGQQIEKY